MSFWFCCLSRLFLPIFFLFPCSHFLLFPLQMVKLKKRDAKADKTLNRRHRFFTCALSGAPLCNPIVACRTGRLYNYEAVLNALIAKRVPKELEHVQSGSDVLTSQPRPLHKGSEENEGRRQKHWENQ